MFQNVPHQSRDVNVQKILPPVYAPQGDRDGLQLVRRHLLHHQLLRILIVKPGIDQNFILQKELVLSNQILCQAIRIYTAKSNIS